MEQQTVPDAPNKVTKTDRCWKKKKRVRDWIDKTNKKQHGYWTRTTTTSLKAAINYLLPANVRMQSAKTGSYIARWCFCSGRGRSLRETVIWEMREPLILDDGLNIETRTTMVVCTLVWVVEGLFIPSTLLWSRVQSDNEALSGSR